MEKYLVLGASPNSTRHSYKAVKSLVRRNKVVIPVGFRSGKISGVDIITGQPEVADITTVLLYIGAKKQPEFFDYILKKIHPGRIVFNPGTENPEFEEMAKKEKIEVVVGCALIMINSSQI
jgi:predicted CoA-binding protein